MVCPSFAPPTGSSCPSDIVRLLGLLLGLPPSIRPGRRAPGPVKGLEGFHKQGLFWAGRADLGSVGCAAQLSQLPCLRPHYITSCLPISERALPHAAGQQLPAPSRAPERPLLPEKGPGVVFGGCQRPYFGVPLSGWGSLQSWVRDWGRQNTGWQPPAHLPWGSRALRGPRAAGGSFSVTTTCALSPLP